MRIADDTLMKQAKIKCLLTLLNFVKSQKICAREAECLSADE